MADTDGAEDVNDFLRRVQQLKTQHNQEDDERNKKLEAEILKSREERQARRAERARSLSPNKSSPVSSPPSIRPAAATSAILAHSNTFAPPAHADDELPDDNEHNDQLLPSSPSPIEHALEQLTGTSSLPAQNDHPTARPSSSSSNTSPSHQMDFREPDDSPSKSSSAPAPLQRTPTLSWQQRRPPSRGPNRPPSRPLSKVAAENAVRSPRATPDADDSLGTSRTEIAQSLASKDPAWFRQTADRGSSSAAYRRNQVEDEDVSEHGLVSSRMQLPGMSREGSREPEKPQAATAERPTTPRGSTLNSTNAMTSGSPLSLSDASRLDPPAGDDVFAANSRRLAMSPTQGRISPERTDRPISPTKGVGGFVQSAMLKRSDSVSKRFSAPNGLSRSNSITGNRGSRDLSALMRSGGIMSPTGDNYENRPGSSHSNAVFDERPGTSSSMKSTNDGFAKPFLPLSRPTSAVPGEELENRDASFGDVTSPSALPVSPSRTMDPRRWSPTKSSWLESALNKPESPKPRPQSPALQQPAWMVEIAKAKQRGPVEPARSPTPSHKHQVSIGGLLRSGPPGIGTKPATLSGVKPSIPTSSYKASLQRPDTKSNDETEKFSSSTSNSPAPSKPESSSTLVSSPPAKPAKPELSSKIETAKVQEGNVGIFAPAQTDSTSVKPSPPPLKPKPETPPKTDLRANLHSRTPISKSDQPEPEFKSVFGTLRKTKTQNYVAPDELKNNILRGKAGLAITGGPKKTERKDEFKEAILAKKKDFQKVQAEGKGVTRTVASEKPPAPIPEALLRKKSLGRADALPPSVQEALRESARESERRLQRQRTEVVQEPPKPSVPQKSTTTPGRLQGNDNTSSKLADRFNPGLANLLARGPPGAGSGPPKPVNTTSESSAATASDEPKQGPQLTHMTKGRARGPRRKAPTTAKSAEPAAATTTTTLPEKTQALPVSSPAPLRSPSPSLAASKPLGITTRPLHEPKLEPEPLRIKSPIRSPIKSPFEAKPSTPAVQPASPPKKLDLKRRSQFFEDITNKAKAEPQSPRLWQTKSSPTKSENLSMGSDTASKPMPAPKSPSLNKAAEVNSSSSLSSPAVSRSGPLVTSPKPLTAEIKVEKNATTQPPQPRKPSSSVTPGFTSLPVRSNGSSPVQESRPLPSPPVKSPLSPLAGAGLKSPSINTPLTSPRPPASSMITEFFHESTAERIDVDATSVLLAKADYSDKIHSNSVQIFTIAGDGRKQLVPQHQERILFDGNIYLCMHDFTAANGQKKSHVYLWAGDAVSDSEFQDAVLFAQRDARNAGAELFKLRQGKETPEFLQALGGVVITRRGTSSRYDQLQPHVLCGRRHLGEITFDEVDYSAQSLCSGFPYLIFTPNGKCVLWKGKGSGVDELSCARLIGMDFGMTGEIEEVDDGNEPTSFSSIFGEEQLLSSADHWRLRKNHSNYEARLFLIDAAAAEKVMEIRPFVQADISPKNIYVLDAFFEVYVIVGKQAQSQYSSFQTALGFVQEYGILAAGMEDRPFVPVSIVLLEGVPRDMKRVFRHWSDAKNANALLTPCPAGLKRGKSLRLVPLREALEAVRS